MIRPVTILTFLMACGSGAYLFAVKHEAQALDDRIGQVAEATRLDDQRIRVLQAQYALETDPQRIAALSARFTALKPMAPHQLVTMAMLQAELPAPEAAPPTALEPAGVAAPPTALEPAGAAAPVASNDTDSAGAPSALAVASRADDTIPLPPEMAPPPPAVAPPPPAVAPAPPAMASALSVSIASARPAPALPVPPRHPVLSASSLHPKSLLGALSRHAAARVERMARAAPDPGRAELGRAGPGRAGPGRAAPSAPLGARVVTVVARAAPADGGGSVFGSALAAGGDLPPPQPLVSGN